ncbi:YhjD/YihY/BrkB family envelope integrity protein [Schaalia sp. Marseille-Q2122]|uniref:YhjD/YihY/BrkB family envelope integrity protein n=1 Tax=Schaalia sp. Marseille-Q2122 TaxID=2736604 RepID=UPI00158BE45C|nr:YhjD/YihY/BrkB family envelope integrity protein [Schaalia sp. Marseille-Q2122]
MDTPATPAVQSPPATASHLVAPSFRQALGAPTFGGKLQKLLQWWPTTRLARTLERYFGVDGDLIASGLALTILISLTAAMTVAWTIFMAVLGTYDEIRTATLEAIASNFPGLIDTPSSPGIVDPDELVSSSAWTPTSIVAFLVMAWTGIGLVGRLGRSLRTVFGLVVLPEHIVKFYLRNLVGAVSLALTLLVGVGVGLVVDVAREWLFGVLSIEPTPLTGSLVWLASLIVPFIMYMGVGFILLQVVAGIRPPKKDLLWGLVLMASASTLLRLAGTSVVSSVSGPLLTTATTLVTLVLWINLQMRVTLMVAAWIANPPRALPISDPEHMRFEERPNYVTMSVPTTLEWPRHMITGDLAPPDSSSSRPLPAVLR